MTTRVVAKRLPGYVPYKRGLDIQTHHMKLVAEESKKDKQFGGYVLLLEHKPVYTVGLRTRPYSDEYGVALSKRTGADFVRTRRGGLITFHGPGQLVSYPILNLDNFSGISNGLTANRDYACWLEQVIIDSLRDGFGLETHRSPDPGVWLGNTKICAMGLQVKKGITSHGIALNCNTDLNWFSNIVPCGLEGKSVTSLTEKLDREICVDDAVPHYMKAFGSKFSCEYSFSNE